MGLGPAVPVNGSAPGLTRLNWTFPTAPTETKGYLIKIEQSKSAVVIASGQCGYQEGKVRKMIAEWQADANKNKTVHGFKIGAEVEAHSLRPEFVNGMRGHVVRAKEDTVEVKSSGAEKH